MPGPSVPWNSRRKAEEIERDEGLVMIPPFDHPDVIAGQGTCGLELVEQRPDVEHVLVPVSGGGLLSGICIAVSELRPSARVVAVEPAGARQAHRGPRRWRRPRRLSGPRASPTAC